MVFPMPMLTITYSISKVQVIKLIFTSRKMEDKRMKTETKNPFKESIVVTDSKGKPGREIEKNLLRKREQIGLWKPIFEQVDDDIEESNDHKNLYR